MPDRFRIYSSSQYGHLRLALAAVLVIQYDLRSTARVAKSTKGVELGVMLERIGQTGTMSTAP